MKTFFRPWPVLKLKTETITEKSGTNIEEELDHTSYHHHHHHCQLNCLQLLQKFGKYKL